MLIEKQLKQYQGEFQFLLEGYFQRKIKQLKKVDSLAVEAVEEISRLVLAGGKRIRPILVCQGYFLAGGKNKEAIRQAALSIELIHSFLLIHDDIIDRDKKRHNLITVNENYSRWGKKFFSRKEQSEHFGNSMALVVGDMAYSMANEILFEADFPAEVILSALKKIQEIVYKTIPGEMLDILLQAKGEATEKEVLQMYDGKTARYTFEGPLHLGVCLAGQAGNEQLLKSLSNYALPTGKAFQLRDDILGVFGEEKRMGKPVGSDIVEGKQTLLIVKAEERANKRQKKQLLTYLGKKDLSQKELDSVRQIFKETGAWEYSQRKAKKLVETAVVALEKVKDSSTEKKCAKRFLKDLAEYIILRQS